MRIKPFICLIGIYLSLSFAGQAADSNSLCIIPWPQKVVTANGAFELNSTTRVVADSKSRDTAKFLIARLRQATDYPLPLRKGASAGNFIELTTANANTNLGPEGYELTVTTNAVVIRAPGEAGLFYGVQTLLQLLPVEIFSSNAVQGVAWQVPCVEIQDWPRFQWRGVMLDVSRHFFTKAEVETVLDAMAVHKLNVFHWHLTDDQGWRIEIKKYPKLTEVGAWRSGVGFGLDTNSTTAYRKDGQYGGYYTAADVREVVKYAAARHINVVPEIEMPGHATAALAAYPELGCTGEPFSVVMTNGVFHGIYDPAKEETFKFEEDVLTEVFRLFPGKYVHIGGDEVPKDTWKKSADCQALMKREGLKNEQELQSWFTRRIEKFVSAHGKTMIGWSEILEGGLPSHAAVMDWIGGAREAASAGHDVVMSPTSYCYLDFYQSSNRPAEPKAAQWGKPLTTRKVYNFDPMPTNLPPALEAHILGTQGNLWTEWVPNLNQVEYMIFPRACALSEVAWSAKESHDFDGFYQRLQIHIKRLDELNIHYRRLDAETVNPGK